MENNQTERIPDGGKTMSSIEWLTNKLFEEFGFAFSDNILQQAKEKHKQEIINAVEWNYKSNMGEVYYLATYKNQENDKV
jgi:hypothetical protein